MQNTDTPQMPPGRDDIPADHPRRIAQIAHLPEHSLRNESPEVQRLCAAAKFDAMLRGGEAQKVERERVSAEIDAGRTAMPTPNAKTNDTQATVGLVSTALLGTIFLHVSAGVRYWEDATVNGTEDEHGTLIPFRFLDMWRPVIDLDNGIFVGWPDGMTAQIHYKVCDAGEYWLADAQGKITHKWNGDYVPDRFLCHGDRGYGDYIILNVGPDGRIEGYCKPSIDFGGDWVALPNAKDETWR